MIRRCGTSLVEVLVVLTIISALMSAVGVCLHGMHRTQRRNEEAVQRLETLSRLSLRLRQDAHRAIRLADPPVREQNSLTLILSGETSIRYAADQGSIERTVWRNGALQHRDGFRLPKGVTALCRTEGGRVPIAIVEISPLPSPDGPLPIGTDRIEAAVLGGARQNELPE